MSGDYVKELEAERASRVARLVAPDGWLTLVERHWLEEGDNQLPIGVVTLRSGVVTLRPADGVEVRLRGEKLARPREWSADDGPAPDVMDALGQRWDLARRGDRFSVRVKQADAPRRRDFAGIDYYPIDPRWRVSGKLEPYEGRFLELTSSSGLPMRAVCPGQVRFMLDGQVLALEPMLEGGRLHFLFGDATNRDTTYGAGRFLYAAMTMDGEVTLDFNLAFNPPCVFNTLAVCPLPPLQNRLAVRIEAGEKRYRGNS